MKLIVFLKIAFQSMSANKLRSALTMLGMIIGVGAVIILMSVGTGFQNMLTSTFQELGTNLLSVQPANPEAPGLAALSPGFATDTVTLEDAYAIDGLRSVQAVVPMNENFTKIVAGNRDTLSVMHGSNPSYQDVFSFDMEVGQFLSEVNVARRDMVVVLGHNIAEDLFPNGGAVGQQVRIKDKRFTVIGVMAPRGLSLFGMSWDEISVTPITTYQVRLFSAKTPSGEDAVQRLNVQVADGWSQEDAMDEISNLMRRRHRILPGEDDDFSVLSPQQLLDTFKTITVALTVFLGLIGSISLLVGSIGIMNIMLVSVTERTREIGLRKAVGAKRRDILIQFLLEAAILSLSGGAIGLLGAFLVTRGLSLIDLGGFNLDAVISPLIVMVAILVSVFIGLASGIYPAMRAARLNPIDALHYG